MPPSRPNPEARDRGERSTKNDGDAVIARLNGLLRLTLDKQREDNNTTVGDQILVLVDAGIPQADACRIIGVDPNQAPSYFKSVKNKVLLKRIRQKRGKSD